MKKWTRKKEHREQKRAQGTGKEESKDNSEEENQNGDEEEEEDDNSLWPLLRSPDASKKRPVDRAELLYRTPGENPR